MDLKEKVKDFVNIYKVSLIMGGVLLLLIFGGNMMVYYLLISEMDNNSGDNLNTNIYYEEKKEVVVSDEEVFYKVDIKGAVINPGVYELNNTSRVVDVITLAGGLKENADTSVINLSKYIKDEMVIVIYTYEEVENFKNVLEEENQEEKQCIIYNEIIQNDSCKDNAISDDSKQEESTTGSEVDVKVSLNIADITLLMTLPGIGESKAKAIIEYREQNGLFTKIDDIMNVSGIGEKLFEEIKDYITV